MMTVSKLYYFRILTFFSISSDEENEETEEIVNENKEEEEVTELGLRFKFRIF